MTGPWRTKLSLPSLGTPLKWPNWKRPLRLSFRPSRPLPDGTQGTAQPQGRQTRATGIEAGTAPPLDLLRERRRELQLEPVSGLLMERPGLLRRGLTLGGMILGTSTSLCALLFLWHQMVKGRMAQLEGYEGQVETLKKELAQQRKALKKASTFNQVLMKRFTDVRSSSALLADLQLRVPVGVQITSVEMTDDTKVKKVKVEGLARDPMGFGRVNAMELVLRKSPLFAATGVDLGKVERVPPREFQVETGAQKRADEPLVKLKLPSAVAFEMTATLAPLPPNQLVAVMEGLQADGMARRLRTLQGVGLFP